jgi:hypothetical protein
MGDINQSYFLEKNLPKKSFDNVLDIGSKDYGKFRVTLLKDMTDGHLNALLTYCEPDNPYLPIYKNEIEYRKQNNIKIDDL